MVVEEDQISVCVALHFFFFFQFCCFPIKKKKEERKRNVVGLFEKRFINPQRKRNLLFSNFFGLFPVMFPEPVVSKNPKRMSLSAYIVIARSHIYIRFQNFILSTIYQISKF